jgi:MFS family permease
MEESEKKKEPEYIKQKKSLNYIIYDGAFWSIMDGMTASFIVPYALFMKGSNLLISLLSSMPDLVASFFQLLAIKVNETFKKRKWVIVLSVFLQASLWIPILLIPRFVAEQNQAVTLIFLYSFFVMLAHFNSPLWRGVVGELVPEDQRGEYFGKRNKVIAIGTFLSMLMAGWILQYFSVKSALTGFTIIFSVAFIARVISGLFLSRIYEKPMHNPNLHKYPSYKYTLGRFMNDLTTSDYGKFVLFICLFRISVYIASPFFAVYELKHLGFSYFQYTAIISAEVVASVLSLSLWGKLNDERGSKTVIILSGLLIPFIPFLYLFSANFYFLISISLFSGIVWAGFNLAVGNFMFDAASPQERVRYASYYQLFNGIAIFIGAITGGFLLNILPDTKGSILALFVISGLGRLVVAIFLFPSLREMRLVELPFGRSFFQYPLIIKPRQRFVQDPFEYYLAYPKKPKKPRPRLYLDQKLTSDTQDPDKVRKEKFYEKKFLDKMLGKDELFNKFFKKK